jgi:hypothetical protein
VSIVLAWSGDALNPAGIEYIVMEKATGYQLREVWGEMNQLQKYKNTAPAGVVELSKTSSC